MNDYWSPGCRLVGQLDGLRSRTRGGRRNVPAGVQRIERELSVQLAETGPHRNPSATALRTFNKSVVSAMLKGEGRKPSWEYVWSLAMALNRLAGGNALDHDALFQVWNETASEAPQPPQPNVAQHYAMLTLASINPLARAIDVSSAPPKGKFTPGRALVAGTLAVVHEAAPFAPSAYRQVLGKEMQFRLENLMEEPILRDGSFLTRTQQLESGFRVWGAIECQGAITSVVSLDASFHGAVVVYFRWMRSTFPAKNRWEASSAVEWGLRGAARLALEAQAMLHQSDRAQCASILQDERMAGAGSALSTTSERRSLTPWTMPGSIPLGKDGQQNSTRLPGLGPLLNALSPILTEAAGPERMVE